MPQRFTDRFHSAVERSGGSLCIGLDSDVANIPASFRGEPDPVLAFNRAVIDATSDLAAAFKPNFAFYESRGIDGMRALEQTRRLIPSGVIALADAKRGDIGNTARHYATAIFDTFGFDAVTVSPYMGMDTLEPFFASQGRGVFVLALTSNPGSTDFQHLETAGEPLYMRVIGRCIEAFGSTGSLGFVVGATHPEELRSVRNRVGAEITLLIPGLGAQGGDLEATVRANAGGGALFNVSRGIILAGDESDPIAGIRRAAEEYHEALRSAEASTV